MQTARTILAIAAVLATAAPAIGAGELPFEIRSEDVHGALRAQVEGTIPRPFGAVAPVLAEPRHWCQFVPIDPTVRGCLWRSDAGGAARVLLFGGEEKTLLPDTTYELPYHFEVRERSAEALEVVLHGDEGPMGSSDYRMTLRARPAGAHGTRLEVATRFSMGAVLESVTEGYLDTLGSDKIGFTVVGREPDGSPRYVQGMQGLIERGAMRHFLALQAYLDSLDVPQEDRFEASLQRWWQLSQRHGQLEEEKTRAEYLEEQRRGYRTQRLEQSARAEGSPL